MAKKSIVSVECEIPGGLSEFVGFNSKESLLDDDIILFNPSITGFLYALGNHQGKPCLSDDRSFQLRECLEHWRRELNNAFSSGKTIFVILADFRDVFVATGRLEHSGTGRNRQTTRIVEPLNNYRSLPLEIVVTATHGKEMKLTREGDFLADYWREFGTMSEYKVLLSAETGQSVIVTKSGDKTAGMLVHNKKTGSSFVLLPYINLWLEDFYEEKVVSEESNNDEEEEYENFSWTREGVSFGKRFFKALVEIDRAVRASVSTTPAPSWVDEEGYSLASEQKTRQHLLQVEKRLEALAEEKQSLKNRLLEEGLPKRLLYEKGKTLETVIIQALEVLGFRATSWRDSESEFDVVFESENVRMLGEAEGKDNKPINVKKLRQLEMNILEDFERKEVSAMAKAVLFGNAFRLSPLDERGPFFTDKCLAAAKRSGTALVRTPDLFTLVQYLSENRDKAFAKKCRRVIVQTEGEIVIFPQVPATKKVGRDKKEEGYA